MRISRRMRTRGLYPFWRSGGYYGNGVHSNVPRDLSQASRVKGLQGPYIRKHLSSSSWNTRVKYWNRLPLAVASVQDHLAIKRQLDNYIYP